MLAIWSLVPLPFLNPACTSESSWWSLALWKRYTKLTVIIISWCVEVRSLCYTYTVLERKVKWALGNFTSNKASGDDGITVELFQILKDVAVKMLHSICQQIWKTQQWPQDWKRSVFIPIPKKGNAKECSYIPKLPSYSPTLGNDSSTFCHYKWA